MDKILNGKWIKVNVFIVLMLILGVNEIVLAQDFNDINSIPIKDRKHTNLVGSPYLNDQWIKGSVKFRNGKNIKNIDLKFDQQSGILIFKNDMDQEFSFVTDVLEFDLPLVGLYRSGFPVTKDTGDKTFFEVLYDGKTKLLKLTTKSIFETKSFYSGTVQQSIAQEVKYFIFKPGDKLLKIKNEGNNVIKALKENEIQLKNYMQEKTLNLKNDFDFIILIKYYDCLIGNCK